MQEHHLPKDCTGACAEVRAMGDYYGEQGGYRRGGGGHGGYKRRRESEPIDTKKQLLQALIYLGDDALPVSQRRKDAAAPNLACLAGIAGLHLACNCTSLSLKRGRGSHAVLPLALPLQSLELEEDVVLGTVRHIKQELRSDMPAVQAMLVDCAVGLSTKLPLYALLLGR